MKSEHWQRVKQVVGEAMTLDAVERESFLDRACQGDSELNSEVRSLLSSHDQAGTEFMNQPAVDFQDGGVNGIPELTRSRRIGPYRIVEEIGRGGMGEDYRAVRDDGQYTKEVAIKLVQGGSGALLERFRYERQILAGLDHFNVARLLDGGTTDRGVPYLVMELVEGTRSTTTAEALYSFTSVCVCFGL
jgi:serine/threonine protein kinase